MTNGFDTDDIADEVVQVTINFYGPEIAALEQYALDNYEQGGHWVAETYDPEDYARVLIRCSYDHTLMTLLDAAKAAIRKDWEHLCMLEREYAFGDE